MGELTAEDMERLAKMADEPNGASVTVWCRDLAALVAAARERDELAALVQQTHGCHHSWVQDALRCQAAEKERDELRESNEEVRSMLADAVNERDELRAKVAEMEREMDSWSRSAVDDAGAMAAFVDDLRARIRELESAGTREDERRDVQELGRKYAETLRVSRPAVEAFLRALERGEHVAGKP